MTAIRAPQAWNLLATNTNRVRVAIIDSENSVHTDIRWARDAAGNSLARATTDYSHGTHVAGIIAGLRNNSLGVAGVCDQCEILPLIHPGNDDERFAEVIKTAVRMDARVINFSGELRGSDDLSAGCDNFPKTRAAITTAFDAGVVFVTSAGNYGSTFDPRASPTQRNVQNVSPASCPGVISVGATDQFGSRSTYTNVGAMLMAPGGGVHSIAGPSAFGAGVGCTLSDAGQGEIPSSAKQGVLSAWRDGANITTCYRHLSGTSMAAPHVAGVVGMMLAANPSLTPAQIRGILQNPANATPITGCTSADCGAGLLNAERAVNMALGTAGAAVAYTGVCRFALGETCTIDTFDELPNGNLSVTAYGKIWNFDAAGTLIGTPTPLTSQPLYTRPNGPCGATNRPASGLCRFDSRTVVNYPGVGYLDSVNVNQAGEAKVHRYWNFLSSGEPWGPEGGSVYDRFFPFPAITTVLEPGVPRYMNTVCQGTRESCTFDSRVVVDIPDWGGLVESIYRNGRYWNFNAAGGLYAGAFGHGEIKDVTRYQPICALRKDVNELCKFDAREIKSNRNEVIFAYGWYFEFSPTGSLITSFQLDQPRACWRGQLCNPFR